MMALTIRPMLTATLAILCAGATALPVRAEDPWSTLPPAVTSTPIEQSPPANGSVAMIAADLPEPDWSLLDSSSPSSLAAIRRGMSPSLTEATSTGRYVGRAVITDLGH